MVSVRGIVGSNLVYWLIALDNLKAVDFSVSNSYIVLECLYKGTEREQIYNVAMEISKGKEVVLLSECNIDFPHVFICKPRIK